MASAYEQLKGQYQDLQNQSSGDPVNFYDYYNAYGAAHSSDGWIKADPYGLGGKFQNFVAGTRDSALQEYNNYLAKLERAREDTSILRSAAQVDKLGLNPLAVVTNSGLVQAPSSASSYSRMSKKESSKASSLIGTALKVLAILALKG